MKGGSGTSKILWKPIKMQINIERRSG